MSSHNENSAPDAFNPTINDMADAVGLPKTQYWFIAIVKHGDEKICSKLLTQLGYENFLPMQRVLRVYSSGRKRWVDHLVLASKVFVHITEEERRKKVVTLPYINRFMVDRSMRKVKDLWSPAAIIPDKEMEIFRRMLGQDETPVSIEATGVSYTAGDKVRVISGKLAGLEGVVTQAIEGKRKLFVSLNILGVASVEIDQSCLEQIK